MPDWLSEQMWAWLWPGLAVLIAVSATHVAYRLVLALVRRFTDDQGALRILLDAAARSLGVAIALLAIYFTLLGATDELPLIEPLRRLMLPLLVLALTWAATRVASAIGEVIVALNPAAENSWLDARKVETQTRVLIRGLNILIVIAGVGAALMTIQPVQRIGTSLLASAGVGGIILGFAARPVLSNLLAGMQIALTQPIRIGDVLCIEDKWCWVEEITATYVVLHVWDRRRLIVPLQWFIDNPFQNWSRSGTQLMGTVLIWVDHSMPIGPLRDEFARLLHAAERWDGLSESVQVVEAGSSGQQVRFVMSAEDSSRLWDLRCEIREGIIAFMRSEYPQHLPRVREEHVASPVE